MKIAAVVTLATLFALSASAAETASARLYCESLRFHAATGGPSKTDVLELTSDDKGSIMNGEWNPSLDPPVYFRLHGPTFPTPLFGQFQLDGPDFVDANGDGFDDFFESSQAVKTTISTGTFLSETFRGGDVTATWSRAAGSSSGTCQLVLKDQNTGATWTFAAQFDLLEYRGRLDYTATTSKVTGSLTLTQSGGTNLLAGPVTLVRNATDRLNDLLVSSGTLTNAAGKSWAYDSAELQRDASLRTNYYGELHFADGDPSTALPDFQLWTISIDDRNDSNGNGIPDLSDDPLPGTNPELLLSQSAGKLLLTITAGSGRTYTIQQTDSIAPAAWTAAGSLSVTNDPQTVTLPAPNVPMRFWRLQSP